VEQPAYQGTVNSAGAATSDRDWILIRGGSSPRNWPGCLMTQSAPAADS
jgi:hypothetical protein